jgi:hypothetical protein
MRSENANNRVTALAGVLPSGGRLGLRGKTTEFPTFSIPKASFAHISAKSCFDTLSECPSRKALFSPLQSRRPKQRAEKVHHEGTKDLLRRTTSDDFAQQSHHYGHFFFEEGKWENTKKSQRAPKPLIRVAAVFHVATWAQEIAARGF